MCLLIRPFLGAVSGLRSLTPDVFVICLSQSLDQDLDAGMVPNGSVNSRCFKIITPKTRASGEGYEFHINVGVRHGSFIADPLQESSQAARVTRSDAGSRSTGRDRPRSRSGGETQRQLEKRLEFFKKVCGIPHEVIKRLEWAQWTDADGWTVLHFAAEHLNKQDCGPLWLDEIHIESFVESFVHRGGDVNAFIQGDKAHGTAALHMVAHKRKREIAEHELHVCRFAKALLVQGQANPNLAMGNDRGQVPMSLAMNTGRVEMAKLLVQHGADPDLEDGQGQTVWEVCSQHKQTCKELRRFIEPQVRDESPWRRRRGEAPDEQRIDHLIWRAAPSSISVPARGWRLLAVFSL